MRAACQLALVCSLLSRGGAAGAPAPVLDHSCQGVEVRVDDPDGAPWAAELSARLCRSLAELRPHFPAAVAARTIRLRVAGDMESYRALSGRAWFIAAVLRGEEILTQPRGALDKLEDLDRVLAHELAHLLLRRTAGPGLPRWLDEGLAGWLSGQRMQGPAPADEAALGALEARLGEPDPQLEAGRAARAAEYVACLSLVARVVERVGLPALLAALPALRAPGARPALELRVAGRKLRELLFAGN